MQNYIDHELISHKHGQWIVLLRCNNGSSAPPGPSVATGMLSVVSKPSLTHFSVLAAASSPQSVGKPKNSHDTVHLLTDKAKMNSSHCMCG